MLRGDSDITKEMINIGELKLLQNEICKISGVTIICLDKDFVPLTNMTGPADAVQYVERGEGVKRASFMFSRVDEGSLEDVAVELVDGIGETAVVAVRADGDTCFYWVIFNSMTAEREKDFPDVIDLIRDSSVAIYEHRFLTREYEQSQDRENSEKIKATIRKSQAVDELVSLLELDIHPALIADRWLKIVGDYLGVDSAQAVAIDEEAGAGSLLSEYLKGGSITRFSNSETFKTNDKLTGNRPFALSSSVTDEASKEFLEYLKLKAILTYPINISDPRSKKLVVFNHRRNNHDWTQEELNFVSEAVLILKSIFTEYHQQKSLDGAYSILQNVLDNTGAYVWLASKETGDIIISNRLLKTYFAEDLRDGSLLRAVNESVESVKAVGPVEFYYAEKKKWFLLIHEEVAWVNNGKALLYTLFDISDKKDYQERVEKQAYVDYLTGLYNRLCVEKDLAVIMDEAKLGGSSGALLYLDLDDFKHINEALGHKYGDELLKHIAVAISGIREIENNCYRMGGDEFVAIIKPEFYKDKDKIVAQIEEIFSKPWYLKNSDYYCTMSMGIALFPDGDDDVKEILKKADIAMFEAKRAGKNRVTTYNSDITAVTGRQLEMEKNMRDGADNDYEEFEVYFQPLMDVTGSSPRCAGAEALVRWNSNKLGFISPGDFIPLAEYLGLIKPIGKHVLKEACLKLKEWNEVMPDFKVNVNLSVVQLLEKDIVETITSIISETGVNPSNVTLEVTESLAIHDMNRMKRILGSIKGYGIKIALDDFGTGYSSLNHIREIPLDYIKVDQSFVKDLASDAYSQSFVRMVTELATTIGVAVCVEGIETAKQFAALDEMGVNFIQGYFFDRPLRVSDFETKYIK